MSKKWLFIFLALLLVSCKSQEEADLTSSATGEYIPEGMTEADKQFGDIRNNNDNSNQESDEEIRTVRPEVTNFILEQFSEENSSIKEFEGLEYRINNSALTSIFKGIVTHKFQNVYYPYTIEIRKIEDEINNENFVDNIKEKNPNLKVLKMNKFNDILLENIGNNQYSGELHIMYENDLKYYLLIKSESMSIPELLMLSEKFGEYLN